MATYVTRGEGGSVVRMHPGLAMPVPTHALTEGAREAVEAVRRAGARTRVQRAMERVISDIGRPPVVAFEGDVVTAGARRLEAAALKAGLTAHTLVLVDRCVVEGYGVLTADVAAQTGLSVRFGFRASWVRGRAGVGSWHEPLRFVKITDDREVAQDARAMVGKAGYRSPGMGRKRYAQVGSPAGVSIGVTEVLRRVELIVLAS